MVLRRGGQFVSFSICHFSFSFVIAESHFVVRRVISWIVLKWIVLNRESDDLALEPQI
jgi:hypothetical protein